MRIVVKRQSKVNLFDKWKWQLFSDSDSGYPLHDGTAYTRHRAVKKAMKHIPITAKVIEQ